MAIKRTTPQSAIDELLNAVPQFFAEEVIRAFSYLGEKCVSRIRDRSYEESWIDHTSNLRSSIGYAVIEDGRKIIESAFNQLGKADKGMSLGRKAIDELASFYSRTYALVVVAGMEYAEYVEAMKGKDVLASTEIWAKGEIQKYLDNAVKRANDRLFVLQKSLGL